MIQDYENFAVIFATIFSLCRIISSNGYITE